MSAPSSSDQNVASPPKDSLFRKYQQVTLDAVKKFSGVDIPTISQNSSSFDWLKYILRRTLPPETAESLTNDNNPFLHTCAAILLTTKIFCGITWLIYFPTLYHIGIIMIAFPLFHILEYFMLSIHQSDQNKITYKSFALFMTPFYGIYAIFVEYLFWCGFAYCKTNITNQQLSQPHWPPSMTISTLGFILIVIGQTYRSLAIYHAKHNFNYTLRQQKDQDGSSTLIKSGLYNCCRHPAYTASAIYVVGLILFLQTPILGLLYLMTLYPFILARIELEEKYLLDMYGDEYLQYRRDVPTLLPNSNIFKLETYLSSRSQV